MIANDAEDQSNIDTMHRRYVRMRLLLRGWRLRVEDRLKEDIALEIGDKSIVLKSLT